MDKKVVNFELPETIFAQLKEIALTNDRSVASQLRVIINDYLKRQVENESPGTKN